MAAVIAACRFASVPATTRAVNADAFEPCSACRIMSMSISRAASALGGVALAASTGNSPRGRAAGSGATGSRPLRMCSCAATIIGTCDVSRMPLRSVASGELSATSGSNAASAETAVRSTSIGCASLAPRE